MNRFEDRIDPRTGERYLAVFERGSRLKDDPILNKGTCFTEREREEFGLTGLLPPAVQTADAQLARAYDNYLAAKDDVQRYLMLAALQDRNETLFGQLVLEHLDEMVPIIYTPTVGIACERYSHMYRRARGLYLSLDHRGRLEQVLRNINGDDVRVIVVTDNEAILGIGDQGVGGMQIVVGKLALYTIGAGIHPAQCLPMDLDVGTNNPGLLADPLYLGARRRRVRGQPYFEFLDELVEAVARVFPRALVQWEDFAGSNAFTVLHRYRDRLLSFNDDIQGTGAVVVAGLRTAVRQVGRRFADERIVFYGAGASGAGSAFAVRASLRAAGLTSADLSRHVMCLDSKGLIVGNRDGLDDAKRAIAVDPAMVADWPRASNGSIPFDVVVRQFKPTVLVGVSGQPGAFSESIVGEMHKTCERPIILALSNPTSKVEATPADLIRWTRGAAVIGTGSPFPAVEFEGRRFMIGQGNNVFIFPGVGLGATVVDARSLPDEAFEVAATALHDFTGPSVPGESIYPPLSRLRDVSRHVALAVAKSLVDAGVAPALTPAEIEQRISHAIRTPGYLPYRFAPVEMS